MKKLLALKDATRLKRQDDMKSLQDRLEKFIGELYFEIVIYKNYRKFVRASELEHSLSKRFSLQKNYCSCCKVSCFYMEKELEITITKKNQTALLKIPIYDLFV